MLHNSIFSTESQVTCRPRHLPRLWIQQYRMALNNWVWETSWKYQLQYRLELKWKACSQNNCQNELPSSHRTRFFKIYTPELPPKKEVFALKRLGGFQRCWVRFWSLNNNVVPGITKAPVKQRRTGHLFAFIFLRSSQSRGTLSYH